MPKDGPRFERAQTRMLRNLGLTDAEIAGVEMRALPLVASWLIDLPPLAEVREPLAALQGKVQDLLRALGDEMDADRSPSTELSRRIALADYAHGRELLGEPFNAALDADRPGGRTVGVVTALREFDKVLDRAVQALPAGQRRPNAHWEPVDAIHAQVPRLHPGRKNFRELVEICYQAAGASADINLEGRIRRYRAEWEAGRSSVPGPVRDSSS